jgi:hypothetical protein
MTLPSTFTLETFSMNYWAAQEEGSSCALLVVNS